MQINLVNSSGNSPGKVAKVLTLSVLFHLAVFYWIGLSAVFSTKKAIPEQRVIIQAQLNEFSLPEVSEPPTIPSPEPQPTDESTAEADSEPKPVNELEDIDLFPEKTEPAFEQEGVELHTGSEELQTADAGSAETPNVQSTVDEAALDSLFESDIHSYLQGVNQSKLDAIAAEAIQQYKHNQRHPVLKGRPSSNLTLDEQLLQEISIEVDCNQTLGSTLNFLSNLIGVDQQNQDGAVAIQPEGPTFNGSIKCRDSHDIDAFINRRLNKSN